MQLDCPLLELKRPARQFAHGAVVLIKCLPGSHALQLAEPGEGATDPVAQSLHSLEPRGRKRPWSQAMHLVLPELMVKPLSQLAHIDAPFDVHSESFFGVPLSHLQEFLSHLVLPELMVKPCMQLAHIDVPFEVHSEPFFGAPLSHVQMLLVLLQFEVQTTTLRTRLLRSVTSAYLPVG